MSGISSLTYERHVNDGQYAGRRVTAVYNLTDGDTDTARAEREVKASVHRLLGIGIGATPAEQVPVEEPAPVEKAKRGRPKKEEPATDPLAGAPAARSPGASKEVGANDPLADHLADLGAPGASAAPAGNGAQSQASADPLADLDTPAAPAIVFTDGDLNKALSAAMSRLKAASVADAPGKVWGVLLDARFNKAGVTGPGAGASGKVISAMPADVRGAFVETLGKLGA